MGEPESQDTALGVSSQTPPVETCSKCGAPVPSTYKFCPHCGAPLGGVSPVTGEPSSSNRVTGVFRMQWFRVVAVVFLAELVAFFLLTALPMSSQQAAIVAGQGNALVNPIDAAPFPLKVGLIFENNFRIASIELVPVLGWFLFSFSVYSTAHVLEAFAIQQSVPGPLAMLSLLFLPHSWLELPAYAIATTQSIYLTRSLFTKSFSLELRRTLLVWLLVGVELAVAATFESAELVLETSNVVSPLVTWIPFFAIALPFLYLLRNRIAARPQPV